MKPTCVFQDIKPTCVEATLVEERSDEEQRGSRSGSWGNQLAQGSTRTSKLQHANTPLATLFLSPLEAVSVILTRSSRGSLNMRRQPRFYILSFSVLVDLTGAVPIVQCSAIDLYLWFTGDNIQSKQIYKYSQIPLGIRYVPDPDSESDRSSL